MRMKCTYSCKFYSHPTKIYLKIESNVEVKVEFIADCLRQFCTGQYSQEEITNKLHYVLSMEIKNSAFKITTKAIIDKIKVVCVCG